MPRPRSPACRPRNPGLHSRFPVGSMGGIPEIDRTMGPLTARAQQQQLPRHSAGWPSDRILVVEIPGKGRGVVAVRGFEVGEVIEVAPVIPVDAAHLGALSTTVLEHYVYDWFPGSTGVAVALGCGSLYNHSYVPNAMYVKDFELNTIQYIAIAPIAAGAEVLVNYNGDPADRTPLWFDVVG